MGNHYPPAYFSIESLLAYYVIGTLNIYMFRKLMSVLAALLFTVCLVVIAFFDFNNRLGIGTKDNNGFAPFDHGIFGGAVKVALALAILYSLYYIFSVLTTHRWLRILLTIITMAGLVVGGWLLSFQLYFTF